MKRGVRNKTAIERLKMAIFKPSILSYMHTTLYISFLYSNYINKFMLCENTGKKFESTNMGFANFKILIFPRLFKYEGRVVKRVLKFHHPLEVANFVCFWSNIVCFT